MYQIQSISNRLIRMFNQASVSDMAKEQLAAFLMDVSDCSGTKGSVIADTLLSNLARYCHPHCSEAQARAVAETAYEYNINL